MSFLLIFKLLELIFVLLYSLRIKIELILSFVHRMNKLANKFHYLTLSIFKLLFESLSFKR